ncbi:aromatic amino acid transporter [Phocoenobacter skyensis]|uniref:Aromatic amino acid permease n=1 Tax=Phocoenobacter skyensis TaxID=97481 RepID=A0A1H7YH29_9PAST|nr:aromatic amino acid transporter [Pasteurella skyensis]MDP8079744.1 aromatic amino acid transporter [Pasteurella skyensis]MDP8085681.1 aromatic amino acid transporter [Pasteurella skyensis]MDP8185450.1 aromatic amino acid transporter [Pasteurella skyensis]QLB22283.1 transposase [Pasteurella skyensis]SEM44618.1 tryptophan-specific transport protein [Pasteurella skyensis]
MNKKTPSIFGGACIIASVCVGAGMLAIPIKGAGAWTIYSTIALLITMAMMTLSGWLLLEAYKKYELSASFSTVTKDLLGKEVNFINNLAVYFVGGILLYAYTTVAGLTLNGLIGNIFGEYSTGVWSIIFVFVFSSLVWHSTRAVDRISVLLILVMVFTFIFGVSGLASNIDLKILLDTGNENGDYTLFAAAMLPVALTSFGYHHSVASMRSYYGSEVKAKYAIVGGTTIALVLYLLWTFSIFGNLPRSEFKQVFENGGEWQALLGALGQVVESKTVENIINAFSMAAILSSFIGVGLGVFDYLADFFKFDNTKQGRMKSWAVTFLPPLILSVLFPFGFVTAIGYAGAVATIWTCIVPALLAKKARERNGTEGFHVSGGNLLLGLLILFGIMIAIIHFLDMFGVLPSFKG